MSATIACERWQSHDNDTPRTQEPPPALVVDSARPMPVMIARFQEGLAPTDSLRFASGSRDTLVRRYLAAIERKDTVAFAHMAIDRAEFAYLFFPESRIARSPYELDPALAWFQLELETNKGLRKTLHLFGGHRIRYLRHECAASAQIEGSNRIWRDCRVTMVGASGEVTQQLFMSIIERDERFKFFSYANRF